MKAKGKTYSPPNNLEVLDTVAPYQFSVGREA